MNPKLSLILALGVGVAASAVARADTISFTVSPPNLFTSVVASSSSVTTTQTKGNMGTMTVNDASNGHSLSLKNADIEVMTGTATSYNLTSKTLIADYASGGTSPAVLIVATGCTGTLGALTDVCLWGTENGDQYVAIKGGTGSFQGEFTLKWVDPNILIALSANSVNFLPGASDDFDSGGNRFAGSNVDGDVTEASVVMTTTPEPGTLLLLGTGLLGLALLALRKSKAARGSNLIIAG